MLVTSKEMLEKARREHYAVPAMNTQGGNYDIIWAICRAAEEMHSPAILAHYVATGAYSGDDCFLEWVNIFSKSFLLVGNQTYKLYLSYYNADRNKS